MSENLYLTETTKEFLMQYFEIEKDVQDIVFKNIDPEKDTIKKGNTSFVIVSLISKDTLEKIGNDLIKDFWIGIEDKGVKIYWFWDKDSPNRGRI